MKIIDQNGVTHEGFEIQISGKDIFFTPKSLRTNKILLGTYPTQLRVIEVASEIYALNSNDAKAVYMMPKD